MLESEIYSPEEEAGEEESEWDYREELTGLLTGDFYAAWKARVLALRELSSEEDWGSTSPCPEPPREVEEEEEEADWDEALLRKVELERVESSGYCSLQAECSETPPPVGARRLWRQCVVCGGGMGEWVRGSCGHETCVECGRAWVGAAVVAERRRLRCPACLGGLISEWDAYSLLHLDEGLRRRLERRALHRVFGAHPSLEQPRCVGEWCPYAEFLRTEARLEALVEVLRSTRAGMEAALSQPLWAFLGQEPPPKRLQGKARWRNVVHSRPWI